MTQRRARATARRHRTPRRRPPTPTGGGEPETLPFTGLGVGLLVLLGALCLTLGLAGWRLAAR